MDVAWLESFLALLEHQSFTRAADAQHISQPAFSRRIRALELWFGEELVDRSTFPVALTAAGVSVRAGAMKTVGELTALREEFRGRQRSPRNAVRVVATHTLATTFFAPWWTKCDGGPVVLLPTNTLNGYDALLHGGCDLLLAYADRGTPVSMLGPDAEWLVVGRDELAPYRAIDATFDLPGTAAAPVPTVTHGVGSFLGRVTERIVVATPTLHLEPVMQSDLTATLAAMVTTGFGVGWLPESLAGQGVSQIGDASLTAELEIRLYRLRGGAASPAVDAVWRTAGELSGTP